MSPKSKVPLDRLGALSYVEGQSPKWTDQALDNTSAFLWALVFGFWTDAKGVFL